MRVLLALVFCLCPVGVAAAQTPVGAELGEPALPPMPSSPAWTRPPDHAPDGDRALLALAGVGVGLAAAPALGLVTWGLHSAIDSGPGYITGFGVMVVSSLLTVPTAVFLFGNLGDRGADYGWTLLAGLLGVVPGAAIFVMAFGIDSGNGGDPGPWYALGVAASGAGLIAGSVLGFELSAGASEPVDVAIGPGGLSVTGHF